ncbi:Firmicu-CTERM sorting domain-containing protein [Companilactobacillus sp. FL22-1]|uniref:Firmicu-CTERM sorting domain-containing protein n=1 Tax=Companilactobacillus sp. FL22-1 TaxID=3373892 RepID=UPI0037542E58
MRKIFLALLIFGALVLTGTTNVEAATNSNNTDIKIDGNFNDWKDKPITKSNRGLIKKESLVADKDNVYFYASMSPRHGVGYQEIARSGYKLTVGDKTFLLTVDPDDYASGNRLTTMNVQEIDGDGKINKVAESSQVYIKSKVNQGNGKGFKLDMEFKLPLSELGITNTASQDITLSNEDLGSKTLHVVGGSTGPVLLAISGLAIALFAIFKMPRIKRLRETSNE